MTTTLDLRIDRPRIQSIDILRGMVMLIMAIDHCRDYFHSQALVYDPLDLTRTSPAIFLTRWITHFCAPIFLFLSGVSAFISGQRKTKKELSGFLIKRGIWLIMVELVILNFGIFFDPFFRLFLLQVIWAIGWSMIFLGLLVRGSLKLIVGLGFLIVLGHNIFDYITHNSAFLTVLITSRGTFFPNVLPGRSVLDAYAILPWTGLMFLGYGFGTFYKKEVSAEKRKKIFLVLGSSVLLLFILLRFINLYGDPQPWSSQKNALYSLFSFINVTKYPPSLLYCCLTIGVAIFLLILLEKVNTPLTRFFAVYGKVPFFYYILHFYLIHLICAILFFVEGLGMDRAFNSGSPFAFRPPEFGYDLWIMYVIWLVVILSLYLPCRWFVRYKQTHNKWWLSYL